jgi:hypothetical protein
MVCSGHGQGWPFSALPEIVLAVVWAENGLDLAWPGLVML